jgi:hypothetical protein
MINNYVCLYGTLVGIMKNKHKLWENTTKGILHWGFTKLFWLMKEIFKLEPQWEKKKKKKNMGIHIPQVEKCSSSIPLYF